MYIYTVEKNTAPAWQTIPSAALLPCRWSPNPPPESCARAVWAEEGLRVRLESRGAVERAENTAADSAVWEDNCLEFFFSAGGENYINLEANARGALRASFGPDRHARQLLRSLGWPLPRVRAEAGEGGWTVELEIPAALLERAFGVKMRSGLALRCNFYACGDKTPAPYYAAWNPVDTPAPDFHRPEFFGALVLG